jgi:hypothetical protein
MSNTQDIILTPWEQALEESESISLTDDPYGLTTIAKEAKAGGHTYITIPVSRSTLGRIYEKAEKAHKTTTKYLEEVVECA